MIFIGVVIGIIILGAVSYFAINKKSSFHTRIVSLAALALMILSVIVCLVIVLTDTRVQVDPSSLIVGAPVETVEEHSNIAGLLFSIIFLLALFAVIAFLAMKEHKRTLQKK
ncbi:MAG: hypothetical protein FWD40_02120 [Treponema sp.]|nr:hypothetical protein [Treponema sp.]